MDAVRHPDRPAACRNGACQISARRRGIGNCGRHDRVTKHHASATAWHRHDPGRDRAGCRNPCADRGPARHAKISCRQIFCRAGRHAGGHPGRTGQDAKRLYQNGAERLGHDGPARRHRGAVAGRRACRHKACPSPNRVSCHRICRRRICRHQAARAVAPGVIALVSEVLASEGLAGKAALGKFLVGAPGRAGTALAAGRPITPAREESLSLSLSRGMNGLTSTADGWRSGGCGRTRARFARRRILTQNRHPLLLKAHLVAELCG